MNKSDILKYLSMLNEELKARDVVGQLSMVGGAVMCLCYDARVSTMDIDAIFEPKMVMYECAARIANENNLHENWLNDGVKGFLSEKSEFSVYKEMSNLNIYVASPEYMLAMKCLSARLDNLNEADDIKFLLKLQKIESVNHAIDVITKFYSIKRFLPKIQYALLEILEDG